LGGIPGTRYNPENRTVKEISSIEIVEAGQENFRFEPPSVLLKKRTEKTRDEFYKSNF